MRDGIPQRSWNPAVKDYKGCDPRVLAGCSGGQETALGKAEQPDRTRAFRPGQGRVDDGAHQQGPSLEAFGEKRLPDCFLLGVGLLVVRAKVIVQQVSVHPGPVDGRGKVFIVPLKGGESASAVEENHGGAFVCSRSGKKPRLDRMFGGGDHHGGNGNVGAQGLSWGKERTQKKENQEDGADVHERVGPLRRGWRGLSGERPRGPRLPRGRLRQGD